MYTRIYTLISPLFNHSQPENIGVTAETKKSTQVLGIHTKFNPELVFSQEPT